MILTLDHKVFPTKIKKETIGLRLVTMIKEAMNNLKQLEMNKYQLLMKLLESLQEKFQKMPKRKFAKFKLQLDRGYHYKFT